jgi:murein DD-endopeptidase MepM/ murein hydrolase activator NlpD
VAASSWATSASVIEAAPRIAVQAPLTVPEPRQLPLSRSANRALVPGQSDGAERIAKRRSEAIKQLGREAARRRRALDAERWVLPLATYRLTGTFGEHSYLWSTVHAGLDFAAASGTAIRAVAAGTVTDAGWAGAYGYRTIVTLLDGTEIWYCHQSSIGVRVGDSVARGQAIGEVGSTGNVTGPHLHLEVRPAGADPVDPQLALPEHGVRP